GGRLPGRGGGMGGRPWAKPPQRRGGPQPLLAGGGPRGGGAGMISFARRFSTEFTGSLGFCGGHWLYTPLALPCPSKAYAYAPAFGGSARPATFPPFFFEGFLPEHLRGPLLLPHQDLGGARRRPSRSGPPAPEGQHTRSV